MQFSAAIVEISMEVPLRTKIKQLYDPTIQLLTHTHVQRHQSQHTVEIHVYRVTVGTIHNSQIIESAYVPNNR
jgi:hypothetical protein